MLVVAVPRQLARRQLALGAICARPDERAAQQQALLERLAAVADLVELLADRRLLDSVLVGLQRGLAALQRVVDRLAGQDARLDAVVDALERHRVDHAGRVADQQRARHRQLGHRPVAAARQRLGAPADALAALEDPTDQRVGLELLQQVVGRRGGVGVVELDDEADRDQVVARSSRPSSGRSRCRRSGRTSTTASAATGPIVWIRRSSGLGTFQTSLTPSSQTWGSRPAAEVELADRGDR